MAKKDILLPNDTLAFILGSDYKDVVSMYLENCFCISCSPNTSTIVDYQLYVNELNDLVLEGKCKGCEAPVNRYLETGENAEYVRVIKHLKSELKKK